MALNTNLMMADSGGGKKRDDDLYKAISSAVDAVKSGVSTSSQAQKEQTTPQTTESKTEGDNATQKKSSSGSKSSGSSSSTASAPSVTQQNVDNTAYAAALSAAEAARQGMPTYAGSFDDQIAQLYEKINGREDFSYDLDGDAFWQQYSDKYTQAAKNAMRDTMGQAAALTGGYSSSYGQAVGQQAYDRRMEELMDIAPELEARAYQRYQDEGDRMLTEFSLARQMANDEYGRYADDYNRWLTERGYADERLDAAYKQQQNNLAFLQSMIALGYTPTAQELADAGLNSAQYAAIKSQYEQKKRSGSGGGGSKKEDSDKGTDSSLSAYQMGVDIGSTYGSSAAAVFQKADKSGLTEKEKKQIYQGIVDSQHLSYFDK